MSLTVDEIRALPAAFGIVTAGKAFGRGRTWCHERARAGNFPVPLLRLGNRYMVRRSDLLEFLGVDDVGPPERGAPPGGDDRAATSGAERHGDDHAGSTLAIIRGGGRP